MSISDVSRESLEALALVVVASVVATVAVGRSFGIVLGLAVAVVVGLLPRLRTHVSTQRIKLASVRPGRAMCVVADVDSWGSELLLARIAGPITCLSQSRLLELLEGPPWPSHLVLDLAGVTFIDADGCLGLEYVAEFLAIRGVRAVLVRASTRTTQIIERSGVLDRFVGARVYRSMDDALEAVGQTVGFVSARRADPGAGEASHQTVGTHR